VGHLEGPASQSRWTPDVRAQALELLIVHRAHDGVVQLRPIHAPSLQVGWPPDRTAEAVLGAVLARYGLATTALHSTSWRQDGDHVVLTYLAVVDPPATANPNLVAERVDRAELARGAATSAPGVIHVEQVVEHALRHLAWLVADDPAIGTALADWKPVLRDYLPEPFRQLGS
jgi:hypothetical protein